MQEENDEEWQGFSSSEEEETASGVDPDYRLGRQESQIHETPAVSHEGKQSGQSRRQQQIAEELLDLEEERREHDQITCSIFTVDRLKSGSRESKVVRYLHRLEAHWSYAWPKILDDTIRPRDRNGRFVAVAEYSLNLLKGLVVLSYYMSKKHANGRLAHRITDRLADCGEEVRTGSVSPSDIKAMLLAWEAERDGERDWNTLTAQALKE